MRLINTTSSHPQLVKNQLKHTDAKLVEVYSAGNTDVIFTQAPKHYELLIINKYRAIKDSELEAIREFFLKRKIDRKITIPDKIKTIHSSKMIEISIPTTI
ncbi:DUF1827 family protein [Streptococcus zalophi]|uniref:DUF1827 family protein n=1 Tax=Streptococcus zalophi TaxID=640031 RepID=A0A934P9R8_9STRE|nr:DUF1827 family protein [Streptococcus zalophi]MBJ8349674.1 DUF1827 family protein [Streptococcus zalophi]MCR8967977.1 DUF1827 family protein [Streptococcus zalophi]